MGRLNGIEHGIQAVLHGRDHPVHESQYLDVDVGIDTALSEEHQKLAHRSVEFAASLGLPTSLEAVGVGEDQFALIAKNTMKEFFIYSNPRTVRKPEEVMEILKLAAH